jgi:hypothetical protein
VALGQRSRSPTASRVCRGCRAELLARRTDNERRDGRCPSSVSGYLAPIGSSNRRAFRHTRTAQAGFRRQPRRGCGSLRMRFTARRPPRAAARLRPAHAVPASCRSPISLAGTTERHAPRWPGAFQRRADPSSQSGFPDQEQSQ